MSERLDFDVLNAPLTWEITLKVKQIFLILFCKNTLTHECDSIFIMADSFERHCGREETARQKNLFQILFETILVNTEIRLKRSLTVCK